MTLVLSRFRPAASFKFWLIATSALAWPVLFASEPALAQCLPDPSAFVSGNAVCKGSFDTNIDYGSDNTPIDVTLAPTVPGVPGSGVVVNSPGGDGAVNLANIQTATAPPFAAATLTANDATITNTDIAPVGKSINT